MKTSRLASRGMPRRKRRPLRPKSVSPNQVTGQLGVGVVAVRVSEMGFGWNPTTMDAGIDGYIEIVTNGVATNRVVAVQVKTTIGSLQSETEDEFSYSCEPRDIQYWLKGNTPVILVFVLGVSKIAYWKDVKAYFNETVGSTIRFHKEKDLFTSDAASQLLLLAQPRGGLFMGAIPTEETLITNLFPVDWYPSKIYFAATDHADRESFLEALKDKKRPEVREWFFKSKMIFSFWNLREEPFRDLCDQGTAESIDSNEWALSDDWDKRRDFVRLLNIALSQYCYLRGLRYNADEDVTYFEPPIDLQDKAIKCMSLEKEGTRTVFERLAHKSDKEKLYCYRHQGFASQFRRFDGSWYLEVNPTYYFTSDGKTPFKYAEDLQSGIKRLERHRGVLGHLLMWKEVLSGVNMNIVYEHLRLGPPACVDVPAGIPDEAWKKTTSEEEMEEIPDEESELEQTQEFDF